MGVSPERSLGRPTVAEVARSVVVMFRLTPAEEFLIQRAAKRLGVTRSEFIRSAALDAAQRVVNR